MRSKRFVSVGCAVACAVATGAPGVAPSVLLAQSGAPAQSRMRISAPRNSCRQIASTPSPLVGSREGMVLLKMQRELSSISASMAARPDSADDRMDVRKVTMLRKGVDSLTRVVVRNMPRIAMRNGDSTRGVMVRLPEDSLRVFVHGVDGRAPYELPRTSMPGEAERMQIEMMIRQLEPQVAQMARGQAPMSFDVTVTRTANAPGYMGVTSSALNVTTSVNGDIWVGYCEYPMVESIEPGSPADKAGLATGDTLLAFNGFDLREFDVNYGRLLVPGQTVRVRFRRASKNRELPVVVMRRPGERQGPAGDRLTCEEGEPPALCDARITGTMRGFMLPPAPRGASGGAVMPAAPTEMRIRSGSEMPLYVDMTPRSSYAMFAGARLTPISEELAATLGVDVGLLVTDVAPQSPAGESGLRSGETVSEVNGVDVRDVMALRRALFTKASEHVATLRVSQRATGRSATDRNARQGTRTVVIHW